MLMGASPALSVHDDNIFELDGNAFDSNNPAPYGGDDWDLIYANKDDSCESISDGALAACSFVSDPSNFSIFTTGGSKDEQEVETSWRHTEGSVPAKDDLLDAFAAQYDNGHLYFGADRYATNGDAQIGFWFFHNEVTADADGTFTGFHTPHDDQGTVDPDDDTNGDILVLSNFSNGGTVPNIRVFEWYGVGDVRLVDQGDVSALCAPELVGDVACAITSGPNTESPWPFVPKQGAPDFFGNGAFYEGGIDLESLGFGGDCFSTFLAETRSSTSITATLKDFVLGGLGECGVTVETLVSDDEVSIGTGSATVSDTATITGTGSVSAPNPTGTVDFYLCGPTPDIASCDTSGELVEEDVALDGLTNPGIALSGDVVVTEVGDYCFFADYSGDDNYDPSGDDGTNECFTVTPAQPTISTSATAGPVDLGDAITDDATLSGTATDPDGNSASGTITFNAYGPDDEDCSGTAAFTSTAPVTGDGVYNSGDFTPTEPGVYRWIASYDGDSPNTLSVSGACNDEGESSTVNQDQPTLSTSQDWTPQDSVTIVAPAGGALLGTASFALFESADCTGTAVYSEDVPVDAATPATVSTNNLGGDDPNGYTASGDGTTEYSWQVSYDSDNSAQAGIDPTCVEVSTLTIDNDKTS